MSRSARVIAVFVVLVAGTLWALRGESVPAPPGSGAHDLAAPASAATPTTGTPEVAVPAETAPRVPVAAALLADRRRPPPADVLRGHVLDPQGRPVPHALAAVSTMAAGAPDDSAHKFTATCDAAGAFSLKITPAMRGCELLLVGRARGWRPANRRLWFEAGDDPVELRLDPGFEISGRVVRNGVGVPCVTLALDLRFGVPGVFGMGRQAFWIDGRFEEKTIEAESEADGTFRLTGLAPNEYRLDVRPQDIQLSLLDRTRQVRAPDPALQIELSAAMLSIRALGPGGVIEGATVMVRTRARSVRFRSQLEAARVAVPPGAEIILEASHAKSKTVTEQVTAPGPGGDRDIAITLDFVPRPTLRLRLEGARAAGVEHVSLALLSHDPERRVDTEAARHGGDEFWLEAIPVDPGEYDLLVGPTDRPGPEHFVWPCMTTLRVPKSGEVQASTRLSIAAHCEVSVDSPSEEDLYATFRLVDINGRTRAGHEIFRPGRRSNPAEEFWETELSSLDDDLVQPDRAARRRGLLPAGRYTLEIDAEGHEPYRQPVVVTPGRTTRFHVALVQTSR